MSKLEIIGVVVTILLAGLLCGALLNVAKNDLVREPVVIEGIVRGKESDAIDHYELGVLVGDEMRVIRVPAEVYYFAQIDDAVALACTRGSVFNDFECMGGGQ